MKKILKYTAFVLSALILIPLCTILFLFLTADPGVPEGVSLPEPPAVTCSPDSTFRLCGNGLLRRNEYGLWETVVSGTAAERGTALGCLMPDLLYYQEKVFVDQINRIVPSPEYLKFLKILLTVFNRNLGTYVPREYREEIYALSQYCSPDFDAIGTPYFRQLNYHAAHDIGHAMQEYMLVGCSSFGAWDGASADSSLIIGRNFDFYVGDGFAENKLISVVIPEQGHAFISVGWPGMIGVLSGMNGEGLTVTINAAKGSLPLSAATPISILTRRILQYASNIDEAYRIADSCRTFVSESILIGSARDGRCAVIEKSPGRTALYTSGTDHLICTNHFQSPLFRNDPANQENLRESDSPYRAARMAELIAALRPMTPEKCALILRDRKGLHGKEIGLTNQKSINLSIAHHSVIFRPQQREIWISTAPWQSGRYLCYNLDSILASRTFPTGSAAESASCGITDPFTAGRKPLRDIAPDTLFLERDYPKITAFRRQCAELGQQAGRLLRKPDRTQLPASRTDLFQKGILLADSLICTDPDYYRSYDLAGDYFRAAGDYLRKRENRSSGKDAAGETPGKPLPEHYYGQAVRMWRKALELEIATVPERRAVEEKIRRYEPLYNNR